MFLCSRLWLVLLWSDVPATANVHLSPAALPFFVKCTFSPYVVHAGVEVSAAARVPMPPEEEDPVVAAVAVDLVVAVGGAAAPAGADEAAADVAAAAGVEHCLGIASVHFIYTPFPYSTRCVQG